MSQPKAIPPRPKFELWQAVRWYAAPDWISDSLVIARRFRNGVWTYATTCGLTADEADLEALPPETPPEQDKRQRQRPRRPR